jgi:RNA polymerase sigma-70 factor (ECF subfamily)
MQKWIENSSILPEQGKRARVTSTINSEAREDSAPVALIARILAGEKHLFHDLIRPVERAVYVMLFMLLRNEVDAEDAAQETFIKIYRNLHNFRGDSKFSTWVVSIARNEGLGWLRKRASHPEEPLDPILNHDGETNSGDFTPALLTDWREIPLETLERKELGQYLCRAVLNLPPIYREVVQLRDMDDLDIAETAQVLGISPGSVKVRLHRARIMLQKELVPLLERYAPRKRGIFGRRV